MSIAMEVGWPASERGKDCYSALIGKKRGWGDDHHKLLQLMMGPSFKDNTSITLDLLGGSSPTSQQSHFVDLSPDVSLPSGWEKCLDLKSGSIYFVNLNTGISTFLDPCKTQSSILNSSPSVVSHELLNSQQSKTLELNNPASEFKCEEAGNPWKERAVPRSRIGNLFERKNLELKLNFSTASELQLSECTVEKVQRAVLARSGMWGTLHLPSTSSGLLPVSTSEGLSWMSQPAASPAISTSSSSSSQFSPKSLKSQIAENCKSTDRMRRSFVDTAEKGKESTNDGSVILTGCKRCLMYVMLSASDPICPRCGTSVIFNLAFSPPKRSKVELKL
ncbi:hypothetical protein O6H91_19G054900 [Diphasiastrum complanatum]|uniref:Uncharacterized protein n=1 Tax=Diphasiastrum complanatum TaxID=34168 RepID=A0ACC2AV77_DIPCM|nr:hypothetical protein O6H91_19G054900 [Diphasiastrum complanatum]